MFNRKNQKGSSTVEALLVIALAVAGVVGYILNLVKLFHIPGVEGHIGEIVLRVIGAFTGIVGAVVGYF